jgi:hypothetical protein
MALPIAQLGYAPNMNLTVGSSRTRTTSPWTQLAVQMLGSVGGDLASNALSRDYTAQAEQEGLSPTKKPVMYGELQDAPQSGDIQQPATSTDATTSGVGSNGSWKPITPTGGGSGPSSSSNAPTFWDHLLHGAKTTGAMYSHLQDSAQQQKQFAANQERESGEFGATMLENRAHNQNVEKTGDEELALRKQSAADESDYHSRSLGIQAFGAQTQRQSVENSDAYRQAMEKYAGGQQASAISGAAKTILENNQRAVAMASYTPGAKPVAPISPEQAFAMAQRMLMQQQPSRLPFGVQDPNAGAATFNLNDLTQSNFDQHD